MNIIRGNISKYQSIRQAVSALSNCSLQRSLVVSPAHSDSVENEEPAFGSLVSNPSSEFYEDNSKLETSNVEGQKPLREPRKAFDRRRIVRHDNGPQSSYEPLGDGQNFSTPASKMYKSFQDQQALEKWQEFKDAHHEKIEVLSHNLLVDDDPEEDIMLFSKNPYNRDKYFNRRFMKGNRPGKKKDSSSNAFGAHSSLKTEEKEENAFGLLSPPRDLYEEESGDEGDERQRKYEEAQLERRHSTVYYGNRMKKLCKERKLVDAFKILEEEMPAVNAKPDIYCYSVLINACGRAGYTKKAFQLYNQMKKRGIKPHAVNYTGLFNACAESPWAKTDGLMRAHKLRKHLQEKQYLFNKTTSHAMIKAFGRCGDIKTSFMIVDEMLEQDLVVDIETISFMLQACITDTEAGFRHALMVWRKMRELRLAPDIYTYNLLIQCAGNCSAGDAALTTQLLHGPQNPEKATEMAFRIKGKSSEGSVETKESTSPPREQSNHLNPEEGQVNSEESLVRQVEVLDNKSSKAVSTKTSKSNTEVAVLPNLLSYKIMPGTAVGLSSLDKAEDRLALLGGSAGLFKQMIRDKVKPNLRTVTQMLDSLPSNKEVEESLLQSMKNIGLVPDTQFLNMLIRKRSFRCEFDSAWEVLDIMTEYSLEPDLITFGCLAMACRTLHNASEFLRGMDDAGFRPNVEIMTALVRKSLHNDNFYYTYEMIREMDKRDVVPDEKLVVILEKARERARSIVITMDSKRGELTPEEKRQKDYVKLFLFEYRNWLKQSKMQLDDHPWAQYRYVRADTQYN